MSGYEAVDPIGRGEISEKFTDAARRLGVRKEPVMEATKTDHYKLTVEEALELAIDAIQLDPRREPYGHHQRNRERAINTLRWMLDGLNDLVDDA